jgi:hypothetical protein
MSESAAFSPVTWSGALFRALSPVRLGLCFLGLLLTILAVSLALWIAGDGFQPARWWDAPLEQARHADQVLFLHGSGTALLQLLAQTAARVIIWGLIGGWIAWAELSAQRPGTARLSAAEFVRRKGVSLYAPGLMVLLFMGLLLVFLWLAGCTSYLLGWGIGAALVAVALPSLLLVSLLIVLCGVGLLSFSIMPAAVAAEGTDAYEALSRGFSYFYQRPLTYALWWGLTLLIAAAPVALAMAAIQQGLVGPFASSGLITVGFTIGLSLFWSLQPRVYLKLRRLVDETAETEWWTGDPDYYKAKQHSTEEKPADETAPEVDVKANAGRPAVAHERIRFLDTLVLGQAGAPRQLIVLLGGVMGLLCALAAGIWISGFLAPAAGTTLPILVLLFGVVLYLGANRVLRGPLIMTARMAAVQAVYGVSISLTKNALPFSRRTRGLGAFSSLLLTAAMVLLVLWAARYVLVPESWGNGSEPAVLAGLSISLAGMGALGIGAVAVEGARLTTYEVSPGRYYLGNGVETVASGLAALVVGLVRFLAVAAGAALAWLLTRECLTWVGGTEAPWVPLALDGEVFPGVDKSSNWLACRLAGFWFLFFASLLSMYPLAYLLRWGVVCYLRARQQDGSTHGEPLDLADTERNDILRRQQNRKNKTRKR